MIIERIITTQIETKDPEVIYSSDQKQSFKSLLSKIYVGKCFKRCYILEIMQILMHSPIIFEHNRNGGAAKVAINFKVKAILYDKFEVIPDAKIIEIMEDGKIVLKSNTSAIMLAGNPKLQKFKVGQTVPIRVVEARYLPFKDVICVQAIPFIPLKDSLSDREFDIDITDDDIKALEPLLTKIEEEKSRIVNEKWFDFLLPSKVKMGSEYKQMDITKIKGTGKIIKPEHSSDLTVYWKPASQHQDIKNSIQVLKGYLNNILKLYKTVADLDEHYDLKKNEPWMELYTSEKKAL